jgi:hypothetical protein
MNLIREHHNCLKTENLELYLSSKRGAAPVELISIKFGIYFHLTDAVPTFLALESSKEHLDDICYFWFV